MSFLVNSCLGCSLDFGTKFIGFFCAIITALATILYGTPALLGKMPETRMIFYAAVTSLCAIHLFLSCLLIYSAFKETPRLMRLWSIYTWCISVLLITVALTGIVIKYVGVRGSIYTYRSNGCEEIIASIYFVFGVLLFYFATVVESQRRKIILVRYRPNDSGVSLLV